MSTRLACVLAEAAKDCGPAALATVALHHGRRVGVLRLHEMMECDLQGADLASLRDAAERIGFEAVCGALKREGLDRVALPLIAHLQDEPRGHFVVVHRVSTTKVVVADPAHGIVTLVRDEFMRRWTRQVVLLRPSGRFEPGPRSQPAVVGLLRLIQSARGILWTCVWLAMGAAALAFGIAFFVRSVFDRVLPIADLTLLNWLGLGMALVILVRAALTSVRQYVLVRLGQRLALSIGSGYVRQLLALPVSFYDHRQSGDVFARFLDAQKITNAVVGPLLSVVLDVVLMLACGLALLVSNVQLMLVTLGFVAAVLAVTLVSVPVMKRRERRVQERFARCADRFMETANNARILKAYTDERGACERIEGAFEAVQTAIRHRSVLATAVAGMSSLLTGAATVSLVWVGAHLTIAGRLTPGELIFFYSILGVFLGSIERFGPSIGTIQEALIAVDRLEEIRGLPREDSGPQLKIPEATFDSIELRGVSFSYRPSTPALANISLRVTAGETVALLGETGSGKSTLLALMNGLYQPRTGEVLINGRSTRDLDVTALRRHVILMLQDPGLVTGTICENITLGLSDVTLDEVREASRRALADDFIVALPRGYDYEVGAGGSGLSAGQRQRVALARALLRKPPVLILDEATSNLDPRTEQAVLDALELSARRRITIIATHRIAIAARAHRIFVLERGAIAETGTHGELIEQRGRYWSMWQVVSPHDAPPALASI